MMMMREHPAGPGKNAEVPGGTIAAANETEMASPHGSSSLRAARIRRAIGPWIAGAAGVAALVLVLHVAACRSATGPGLEDGVLATFDVHGERFSVFVTNEATIDQIIALWNGQSRATIPTGRVRKGRVAYNQPWSWHIDSEEIEMAEATIELCDGLPSYVEANLDEWIETVGTFCPWAARLIALKDYR